MMQVNALRQELQILMKRTRTDRPPALRRSIQPEWLYASDISAVCSRDETELFLDRIREKGWEYTEDGQWILLRKPAEEPPEDWFKGMFGNEAGCCLSLLKRHPERMTDAPEAAQRMLIRAGEEGPQKYETVCAELHRNWAERLRRGEALPALSLFYFSERKERDGC